VEDSSNPDATPFVVDASGNVGIGLSSPAAKLQVKTGANQNFVVNTQGGELSIESANDAYSAGAPIRYYATAHTWFSGANTMRLDASGNLGLGVTPSAWSGFRAFDISNVGCLAVFPSFGVALFRNAYYDGSVYRYKISSAASYYDQDSNGVHAWFNAPSGTAGATTSITSGRAYSVTTLGSTTLGEWQAFFSALTGIPSIGQTVTATATGTLAGGATVTQIAVFTQAMTLDASGNLVVGSTTTTGRFSANTGDGVVSLRNFNLVIGSGTGSAIDFLNEARNAVVDGGMRATNLSLSASGATPLLMYTNATERARITSGGEVLFGLNAQTNTPANGFVFQNLGTTSSQVLIGHSNSSGSGTYYEAYFYDSTVIGSVTQNGTTGVLYNITSDYRLKTVTGPVTDAGSRIDALEPVEYTWKANGSSARGFLAHKFQEVYPNSVTGQKDAIDAEGNPVYQNMQASTSEVIADLVAELQSLRARVAQLEAK
jgi:hypothetical protein